MKRIIGYLFYSIIFLISKKTLVSIIYWRVRHKKMNWKNPMNLNEKMNWLKFNSDLRLWADLSDKFKVRDFVKKRGLDEILIPIYGKWRNVDDINFELLPNSFVLKANHDSGSVFIVKDKKMEDLDNLKKKLKKSLKNKFGILSVEPWYLDIEPCIIAEELLIEKSKKNISTSIVDYKFYCLNGKPESIMVCYDRNIGGHSFHDMYDLSWNRRYDFMKKEYWGDRFISKPNKLSEMILIAEKLSKGFPIMRVDLYEINNKVYFSEMTVCSYAGFIPDLTDSYLLELGKKVKLK